MKRYSNLTKAALGTTVALGAILLTAAAPAQPVWQSVTVSNLPVGSRLGSVWARNRNEAYVWATLTNSPQSFLFKWGGTAWGQVLTLTNHSPGKIFGTGPAEVFVSADYYPTGAGGASFCRVYRSTDNGTNWTQQVLPGVIANTFLNFGYFGGTPNNVHFHSGSAPSYVARFDGTTWSTVFTSYSDIYGLTLIGANEGYYVGCATWGSWDGTSWQSRGYGAVGCDVYGGVWGMRDAQGKLSMYATGQNNFNNGPHVWRFDETNSTWSQVFSDGPSGNGVAIWGSAPDDIYVVGELISGQTHSGRVYHFDGASWSQVTSIGAIPPAYGVSGSASNDVWVSLGTAGTLLHIAPPALLDIAMYAGITIEGQIGATYQIEYTTNVASSTNWVALTNLTLTASPYLFYDSSSAGQARRYYRAMLVP